MKSIFQRLYRISASWLTKSRTIFWRLIFGEMGNNCAVYGRIVVYYPENITIGDFTTLNEGVVLNARAPIDIGNHVRISPGVLLTAGGLKLGQSYNDRAHHAFPIKIEDGVWVGTGAIILPGVTLGKGSVVAAGAVVTKDVANYTLVAGVPAKKLKRLT